MSRKRYSVLNVLDIIDEDNTEFGSADESDSDTDSEYEDGEEESTCTVTVNNHEHNNDADNTDDVLDLHEANKAIDTCVWRFRRFDPPDTTFSGPLDKPINNVLTLLQNFQKFVTMDICWTVLYNIQINIVFRRPESVLVPVAKKLNKF